MDKRDAIKILTNGAYLYSINYVNKNMLIIFQNNSTYQYIETLFLPRHFLHLTGVKLIDKKMGASYFYRKCLDKRLSPNEFLFKEDGTTEIKLSILEQMMKISNFSRMIGDYNCLKPNFITDKVAGTISNCMGLKKDGNYYVPNTILREDTRNLIGKSFRIVSVFSKSIKDEKYSKVEYIAKKFDVSCIYKNEKISCVIFLPEDFNIGLQKGLRENKDEFA